MSDPSPSNPPGNVLAIAGLFVRYGQKEALSGIDFTFAGGSIGLLGPNGAGKSSLLRTLLGLVKPAAGTAKILGFDCRVDGIDVRLNTGYMPESDCHIPGLSGLEFVSYSGRLCGMSAVAAKQRAHEVLLYCGLDEERYRPVDQYSRGMKQKAKLAAALVHDPAIVLLDEPTNGLDPQARAEILDLMYDLGHSKGIHLVLSSHLLKDVEKVCDDIVVLDRGRVRAAGGIEQLKNRGAGFVVRVNGEGERFKAAAVRHGYSVETDPRGALLVMGQDGRVLPEVRQLFEIAREVGTSIRHLAPLEESLEQLFVRALTTE
jgi:ABC-2 type transport system ATP-binding protein